MYTSDSFIGNPELKPFIRILSNVEVMPIVNNDDSDI